MQLVTCDEKSYILDASIIRLGEPCRWGDLAPGQVIGYGRNENTIAELATAGFDVIPARDVVDGKVEKIPEAVELAVRRVMQTGGEVEVLPSDQDVGEFDQIGALLRY